MGVPRRITIDLKSYPNDKDLTHKISNQKIKSQFPDYVQPYLKQYIDLLGINNEFGYLHKDLEYSDVEKGSLKKREKYIDRLCNYIKKYGEAVKSGFYKDLSEEELPQDVFLNIEHVELAVDECSATYIDICTEEDKDGDYVSVCKLDKQKYEDNVDKDFPGLRKVVDLLRIYHDTIKYERLYPRYETIGNISYSTDESDDESEDEIDNDRLREMFRTNLTYSDFEDESDVELTSEDLQDVLRFIENEDEEITACNYDTDTDIGASDISDFDSD